jgi:hypothetical protein
MSCTLVAKVKTMSHAKTSAGVRCINAVVTMANSVICIVITKVMWVCTDISRESGGRLVYVTTRGRHRETCC